MKPRIKQQVVELKRPDGSLLSISNESPLCFILGPCALETRDHALFMAEKLADIAVKKKVSIIFKSSFDKANRTSMKGYRGIALDESLRIFEDIKSLHGLPVLTDVHLPEQCAIAAEVVDVLQIPAYLCRQTDLLTAAAETGCIVNVKKGQFLAPWDMRNVVDKLDTANASGVLITERGTSFGYNTLVVDMRSPAIMASQTGKPIIFDATHSVQQPGGQGDRSGGQREFAPILARAAVAVGVAGVFIETHQDPDSAPSDGPNMIPLAELATVIDDLIAFDAVAKARIAY
jgi:2-dehydro-3-deoxyphosphooctonate aldolase (KDO 8-P synthase)